MAAAIVSRLRESLLGPLAALWPNAAAQVTIFSVDVQSLKLLHAVATPKGYRVTAALVLPLQENAADSVSELRQWCSAQALDPETVLVANPAHLTTTRVFSVPSANWQEIRDIVELQAEKHTPYSKEEILTDFAVVESESSGYSKVMLAISHQDVVNRAVRLVESMGWSLERVALELEGLAGWLKAVKGVVKQPQLLVDLDVETATVVVVSQGKVIFHRSLSFGMRQLIAEPAGVPNRLVAELKRTLDAFEAEGWHTAVSGIVLTGQIERLPEVASQVAQALELPCEAIAAAERFQLAPEVITALSEFGPVSFASLLGLLSHSGGIDLTPKPLRLHRSFELRTRRLVTLGCQLIAVLMLATGILVWKGHRQERKLAFLRADARQAEEAASALDFSLKQVELVRGWLAGRGKLLELLVEVSQKSSDAIRWDSLEFLQADKLVIKGTSTEMPRVYDLVNALDNSRLFRKVETKKVTKRRDGTEHVTSFELTCELRTDDA